MGGSFLFLGWAHRPDGRGRVVGVGGEVAQSLSPDGGRFSDLLGQGEIPGFA